MNGLPFHRDILGHVPNLKYFTKEVLAGNLSDVTRGFSEGYWFLPHANFSGLRLDSKLVAFKHDNESSSIFLEELFAAKGKVQRKNLGRWPKETKGRLNAGPVETREASTDTRY